MDSRLAVYNDAVAKAEKDFHDAMRPHNEVWHAATEKIRAAYHDAIAAARKAYSEEG